MIFQHLLVASLFAAALRAQVQPADRILGRWNSPSGESTIEIVKCADAYCGSIKAMKTPRLDANNPDASLRKRPLVGLQVLRGFHYAGALVWKGGTLYGPARGREVSPKLELTSQDTLEIKVPGGLGRRSVLWTRVK